MQKLLIFTASFLMLSYGAVYGQTVTASQYPDDTWEKMIFAPTLSVPKEAVESGLGGEVRVAVTIDGAGNVTDIKNVSGPTPVCQQVTRPDVLAMRAAAREAAMLAKFDPTDAGRPTGFTLDLKFIFPVTKENSELIFSAASDERPRDPNKFTVKGDINYSAAHAPPPDYKGPVSTGEAVKLSAGTETTPSSKQLSGGVLNGKAERLPKPSYPPAARAVRASGTVTIQVLIDETGEVFSAKTVSGHPLPRSASTIAACGAKFLPTRLDGAPVKVSGMITYNFVP